MKIGRVARTHGARVTGIVSCLPPKVITNEYFEERFGDKVAEVVKMTGVQTRHWVETGVTTSDLCEHAANRLLQGNGWDRGSIDAIIFVSQTPDYRLPATACSLQFRLGLAPGVIAFDVPLGCSGYPYGLWLASMMVQTKAAQRVLLLVGDTSSVITDPQDRSTVMLFGDAGTATAIEADENAPESTFILGTDGAGAENLIVPKGAFRVSKEHPKFKNYSSDTLYMDGSEIFNFTLKAVPSLINETVEAAGHALNDYDFFILHQANAFMIRHLAKKAKLNLDRVPINIGRFGNTSSATIPLVLTSDLAASLREQSLLISMFGFGVGYSWSSASMRMSNLECVETVIL